DPHRRGGGNSSVVPGQSDHRVVLRHSRSGQLHDRCNLQPGFHCGAGNGFSRVGAVHRRADPDRYLLHYCRSAGEAAMTSPLPIMPVVLWTDALVFLLVAVILIFAWHVRRHEHLLAPWRKVAHSRSGMVAVVVLTLFIAIGLLDSLHFRTRLSEG